MCFIKCVFITGICSESDSPEADVSSKDDEHNNQDTSEPAISGSFQSYLYKIIANPE